MPRRIIQRLLPDRERMTQLMPLQWLGNGFKDPQVWHLNRRSVAGGVAVGLFVGWLPVPLQMALAGVLAIWLHVNLPISVLLVWFSNPFTLPPLLYAAYHTGTTLLGLNQNLARFEPSLHWVMSRISDVWLPLAAGCLFLALVSAVLGFFATRLLWRLALTLRWRERRLRLRANRQPRPPH